MQQSINSEGMAFGVRPGVALERPCKPRSLRGLVIGLAISAALWVSLGAVALRLF